jgi:hypothetical protein
LFVRRSSNALQGLERRREAMENLRFREVACCLAVICLCGGLSREAHALQNYANHPELAQAMQFDPETNGCDVKKADRAKAEYHYLRYLEDVNDSFQRARVYCQLGAMYAVTYNREKGEQKDRVKARAYYRKVLENEPNRIARPTIVARNMLTTLDHPGWMDRVKARVEFYKWVSSFDEKTVKEKWLPHWKRPASKPGATEASEQTGPVRIWRAGDPNVPTPGELLGTVRALEDYKESAIYNAIYDALAMEAPEQGLAYILEQLPKDAKERAMVEKEMKNLSNRVIDEGLRDVLNTLAPDPQVVRRSQARLADDVNGVPREDPNRLLHEITTAKRRFIPHMAYAKQQGLDPVLDLKTGQRVPILEANDLDDEQALARVNDLKQGDLAWADMLLAVRKARVIPRKQEGAAKLQAMPGEYVSRYKLPDSVPLPYTLTVRNAEGVHYLVKIIAVQEMGIEVLYRRLSSEELSHYVGSP